jgi:AraC-like DNA-binding protein
MRNFLKCKSVGGGMMQLLHDYCLAQNLPSPVVKQYLIDERVSFEFWLKTLQKIYVMQPVVGLGLKIAQYVQPGHIGIAAYLSQSCENLAQYFKLANQFVNMWYHFTPIEIEWYDNNVMISWPQPAYVKAGLYVFETGISQELMIGVLWYRLCNLLGKQNVKFNWLEFTIARPKNLSGYKIFNCPVGFSKERTQMSLPISMLFIPLKTPDPVLNRILEQQALHTLEQLPQQNDIIEQVNLLIIDALRLQCANVEWVAEKLNISSRQLQKILKERDQSFQVCLNNVRKKLALQYLNDRNLSITDVAFMLSYKEVASFNRSFKLWMGVNPSQFRQQNFQKTL